jgi:hypothetical protein
MFKAILGAFGYVKKGTESYPSAVSSGGRGGSAICHGENSVAIGGDGGSGAGGGQGGKASVGAIATGPITPGEVTSCSTCNKVRAFKASKFKKLEEALAAVPAGVRFTGLTIAVVEGDIKLLELKSKDEALELMEKVRKGTVSLVF